MAFSKSALAFRSAASPALPLSFDAVTSASYRATRSLPRTPNACAQNGSRLAHSSASVSSASCDASSSALLSTNSSICLGSSRLMNSKAAASCPLQIRD
eukprot:6031780-Pleurochrysis_carterae.AAC.1